ncbi:SpoIID/LytB domain-containing protein [Nocardia uniformis]|uniref:SpoIID/LytB domain-containing protein n=1 Tax=Nocardia uniformis TaxID=53432 RepID=UPI00082FB254|nr:SpoIID/LytB domain-containing protein [Nocardia uniformis]
MVTAALTGGTAAVLWAWPEGRAGDDIHAQAVAGPYGHGRGLSQHGALNQAKDGWTAESILAHYYPGAELGAIGQTNVLVRLMAQDDSTLDVYSDAGLFVAGRRVIPGQAAHLTATPNGADVVITSDCDGEVLWEGSTDDPWVYPVEFGPDRPAVEHLALCGGSAYRGALGVALDGESARTVNDVDVDDYLRGVVPAEMQANWADQGGAEALRAQAIAARSYALSETRYAYAQTCDTTDCQAYPGTDREDDRATAAVFASSGQVLLRDGHILRSEYSAAPDGGSAIDIQTLAVGPTPAELAPGPMPSEVPSELPTEEAPTWEGDAATDLPAVLLDLIELVAPEPGATAPQPPAPTPARAPNPGTTLAPTTASTPTPPAVRYPQPTTSTPNIPVRSAQVADVPGATVTAESVPLTGESE